MAHHCLPNLRVFLDTSLLAMLVLTAVALHRRVTTTKKPDATALYDHQRPSFRRRMAIYVLVLKAWGVLGLVLSLQQDCPAAHWLVVLCLSLSGGCILVGAWLGLREVLLTFDCDILTLLSCLRCSCCSRLTKRALLLPPLALLSSLNLASWLESRPTEACTTSELLSPETFFAGAVSVFMAMFVVTLVAVGCSMSSCRCRVASTRTTKTLMAFGLAVVALTCIGWGVAGLMSLPRHRDTEDVDALYDADRCWGDLEVFHAAQWSIAQLLVIGGLLLVTTFCCRLENFFLAPSAPEVDQSELSPRLATIKTALDASDNKASETRTPQDAVLV